jgi:hypothetical protein
MVTPPARDACPLAAVPRSPVSIGRVAMPPRAVQGARCIIIACQTNGGRPLGRLDRPALVGGELLAPSAREGEQEPVRRSAADGRRRWRGSSRTCPACGEDNRRIRAGEAFRWIARDHTGDADLPGARNINPDPCGAPCSYCSGGKKVRESMKCFRTDNYACLSAVRGTPCSTQARCSAATARRKPSRAVSRRQ